ncbi:MAG: hypothetical protein U0003_00565 [Vampirovibrionales bacterium]
MEFDATFWVIMLSFFLFMGMMRQVYFEPIRAIKAQRQQEQALAQRLTAEYTQNAQTLEAAYHQSLGAARQQSQQLISARRKDASAQSAERLQTARSEAALTLAAHTQQLQQQAQTVYTELVPDRTALTEQLVQRLTQKAPALVSLVLLALLVY